MSDADNKVNYLKKLYKEIVLGFSVSEYSGKPIFIKHFSELDNGEQEACRIKYEELAANKGLQTREDKMTDSMDSTSTIYYSSPFSFSSRSSATRTSAG